MTYQAVVSVQFLQTLHQHKLCDDIQVYVYGKMYCMSFCSPTLLYAQAWNDVNVNGQNVFFSFCSYNSLASLFFVTYPRSTTVKEARLLGENCRMNPCSPNPSYDDDIGNVFNSLATHVTVQMLLSVQDWLFPVNPYAWIHRRANGRTNLGTNAN